MANYGSLDTVSGAPRMTNIVVHLNGKETVSKTLNEGICEQGYSFLILPLKKKKESDALL